MVSMFGNPALNSLISPEFRTKSQNKEGKKMARTQKLVLTLLIVILTFFFSALRVIERAISAFSLPFFRKVFAFFPPLWQRGGRGDFINHKQLHIPSITPPIFSKTPLSENLRTFIKIAPENPVLWTGMKGVSAKGRKNLNQMLKRA